MAIGVNSWRPGGLGLGLGRPALGPGHLPFRFPGAQKQHWVLISDRCRPAPFYSSACRALFLCDKPVLSCLEFWKDFVAPPSAQPPVVQQDLPSATSTCRRPPAPGRKRLWSQKPLLAVHEGADVPLNRHEQHVAPLSAGVIRHEDRDQMKPQNVSRRTGLCLLSPGGPGPGLWGRSPGRLELDLEQLLKSGQAPAWASQQAQEEEPPRTPRGAHLLAP